MVVALCRSSSQSKVINKQNDHLKGKYLDEKKLRNLVNLLLPPTTSGSTRDAILNQLDEQTERNNSPLIPKLPRIVGGTEVTNLKYPFMVAGYYGNSQFCGGALIAPSYVLTAAHCSPYIRKVRIGLIDKADDTGYEEFNVISEAKHPGWDSNTLENDFMVLELDGKSSYTPIVLDDGSSSLKEDTSLVVMGWGNTSTSGNGSKTLLEADVKYKSNSKCNANNIYRGLISDTMMCASANGKDACQGDSGGPLIEASSQKQVGVVSWGYGCADSYYPGVYARVSTAYSWIMEVIGGTIESAAYKCGRETSSTCQDENGWVDKYGDSCLWYTMNDKCCDSYGGVSGSNGLTAGQACCECGGGQTESTTKGTKSPTVKPSPSPSLRPTLSPSISKPEGQTYSTVNVDSGNSDTQSGSPCIDIPGWKDSYGDTCDWYSVYDPGCPTYGHIEGMSSTYGSLEASKACCTCGGGMTSSSSPPPAPAPETKQCSNYVDWKNNRGKNCEFFESNPHKCEKWIGGCCSNNGTARDACCVCGGGIIS